jgi:hypothetical protein
MFWSPGSLKEVCARYGVQIADVVADVLGPKIKVCVAPVFKSSSATACLFKRSGHSALTILPRRAPSITCEIKRLLFRIRNCRSGNINPCIEQ